MANPCAKSEVSSLSCSANITWGVKFYNGSPDADDAPFREDFFFIDRVALAMINQCTTKVSKFTHYEAMNGGVKCRKWGGLR